MPRLRNINSELHIATQGLARTAMTSVTSPAAKASSSLTRDLYEVQRRTNAQLTVLGAMPFANGQLFENVKLPGIRGQVAAFAGIFLKLASEQTLANFAVYNSANPLRNATVFACDPNSYALRGAPLTGSPVQIASTQRSLTPFGSAGLFYYENFLISGSGDWDTVMTGLTIGDYLVGDSIDLGPNGYPARLSDGNGLTNGEFADSAGVLRLPCNFGANQHPSGVLVVKSRIQAASLTWLSQENGVVQLGSKYACIADLWVY